MNEVFIPAMGMAPDDVTLVSWLKQPGDALTPGEPIALVETSKAELEIEADAAGVLGRHLFAERDRVAPGTTIAYLLKPGESEPDAPPTNGAGSATGAGSAAAQPAETQIAETQPAGNTAPPAPAAEAGPAAATDDAVAEAPIQVSGAKPPAGDVTAGDVTAVEPVAALSGGPRHSTSPRQRRLQAEAALQSPPADAVAPAPQPTAVAQPGVTSDDRFRAAIGASVQRSWQEIPHFAVTRELRAGELLDAVTQWRAVLPSLTLTDLLLRALALTMIEREHRTDLDIGMAVATERGVAIPVIRGVLQLDLMQLVAARKAAAERARAGKMNADDGRVPATTLSNLGAVGVDQFTGVVPYGQTSLLTVGRAAPRPVVDDGELAVATTMQATLNVDHRSWDGFDAGQALDRLARIVAAPTVFLGGIGAVAQEGKS